jgi:hypothetical protein
VDARLAAAASAVGGLLRHRPPHLNRSTELLRTRLDDAIPFWPWTRWCYLPFYAAVFIIAIVGFAAARCSTARARGGDRHDVGALGTSSSAPSTRARPAPALPDISSAFMALVQQHRSARQRVPVAARRAHDHAVVILLTASARAGAVALVMATLLALSTLTTKQHFVADVLSGYALAPSWRCSRCAGGVGCTRT